MPDLRHPFDKRRLEVGLRDRSTGIRVWELLHDSGSIPVAILGMATEPTATDTVVIGADTYEFVATAGAVTDDSYIAVELTGTVADTVDNLVDAINAVDPDNLHANITNIATTAPALANGTEYVLATEVGSTIVVQYANGPGGAARVGDPSIVLGETLTDASDLWDVGNVNLNTLAGAALTARRQIVTSIAITAAMITAGSVRIDLPWQPTHFTFQGLTSAGVQRGVGADAVVAGATGLTVTLVGGVSPDLQATDVLTVVAYE